MHHNTVRVNLRPPESIEVRKTLKISRRFHANRSQISKNHPILIRFSFFISLDQALHPQFYLNQIQAFF